MNTKLGMRLGIGLVALLCLSQVQAQAPDGLSDKVAALKKNLQQNQINLKQYEWVDTVTVSKDGDQKSQKQFRCYYGVDGTLQKTLLSNSQDQDQGGGRGGPFRRAMMANKKEEMADYMQQAVGLIKKYIPPQASQIQAAMEANKISFKPNMANQTIALNIQDYLLPGDSLNLVLNTEKSDLTSLSVNSYLDNPKDTVTMQVTFANLPDGTSYTKQTLLTAKEKKITVLTESSGYKKM